MKPQAMQPTDHQHATPVAPEPAVPVVRIPVDARGLALSILAVIGVVLALEWAQGVRHIAADGNPHRVHAQSTRGVAGADQDSAGGGCAGRDAGGAWRARVRRVLAARADCRRSSSNCPRPLQVLRWAGPAADQSGRHHAENAKRRDRGGEGDHAGGRRTVDAQATRHACRDRPADVQARRLSVGGVEGCRRRAWVRRPWCCS